MPKKYEYDSVIEMFEIEFPEVLKSLEQGGCFWPKVKDNTISNVELARDVLFMVTTNQFNSSALRASAIILVARTLNWIPSPSP